MTRNESQLVSLDMPRLTEGWEWAPTKQGFDCRRCTTCRGEQVYVWNTWVRNDAHPCDCEGKS